MDGRALDRHDEDRKRAFRGAPNCFQHNFALLVVLIIRAGLGISRPLFVIDKAVPAGPFTNAER